MISSDEHLQYFADACVAHALGTGRVPKGSEYKVSQSSLNHPKKQSLLIIFKDHLGKIQQLHYRMQLCASFTERVDQGLVTK